MTTQPVIDHRGDSAPAAVVDDYPLGERPPVTWWQVQNIPYAIVEFITPIAISVTEAMLDLISIALLGKPWSELAPQVPPNGEHNPARPSDCARPCGAPGCASWGYLS